jgi:hypothetical protein
MSTQQSRNSPQGLVKASRFLLVGGEGAELLGKVSPNLPKQV